MDIFDYYYIYTCLKKLVTYKKITKNVANKVLKKYEEECGISMKKKSAYKGKIHLSKQSSYMGGDDRIVCDISINLYKVGKDTYEGKKGKAKIKVKVYKNKIVIKQKGYTEGLYTDMDGTYKKMKK